MSQSTDVILSPNISGTAQRTELNDILQAFLTGHSGASRPGYLTGRTGGWTKIVSGTIHELYYFDGTDDILMGTVNFSTNTFSPAGQIAGFANAVDNKTAAYTLVSGDLGKVITCNASGGAFALAVTDAASLPAGWYCIVQKTDGSANAVTIDPNASQTVNGVVTLAIGAQYDSVILLRASSSTFLALWLPNKALLAPLASPALTGTPTAPTANPGTNNTQIATTAYVDERGVPPGAGTDFWGGTLPNGWLWAAGQAVSRTTYARLFAAISTTHGAGDGSTTFNLPDKRGRVSVGKDDMNGTAANRVTAGASGITGTTLGATGGVETVTLTTAQLAAHNHTASFAGSALGTHTHTMLLTTIGSGSGNPPADTRASGLQSNPSSAVSAGTPAGTVTVNNNGSGNAHQNMQPSIICNYIIKT